MNDLLWWVVIGLGLGLLARVVVPGWRSRSLVGAVTVGLVGSLLGGGIAALCLGTNPLDDGYHTATLLAAGIGAMYALDGYVHWAGRSDH
jgi:uncharacterized membrane protein YeaQ/YmgE (transglycosylase-associated protein family)